MARLMKDPPEVEKTYLVELTQSEIDFVVGIMSDISEDTQRKVRMSYEFDESYVRPTAKGISKATAIAAALILTQDDDYDYFDFWEETKPRGFVKRVKD